MLQIFDTCAPQPSTLTNLEDLLRFVQS